MTTPLTDAQLADLQRLCDAATPGPWEYDVLDDGFGASIEPNVTYWAQSDSRDEDARFIAASRTALPLVVAEVQRLRSLPSSPLSCVHGVAICLECAEDDYAGSPPSDGARRIEWLEEERERLLRENAEVDKIAIACARAEDAAESARRVVEALAAEAESYHFTDGMPAKAVRSAMASIARRARAFLAGERGGNDHG